MALQKILNGVQSLTLSTAARSKISNSSLSIVRCFHTSPVSCRVLNRRLWPINRNPSSKGRWEERKPMRELYKYTVRPLPLPHHGGRGPNGRVWNWREGGGNKHLYRMVDLHRCPKDLDKPMLEKVEAILYDPNRSGRLALLAGGEMKRYVIATVNMQVGDVVSSSRELFDSPIRAAEGDAYPVGSLAIGTIINSLELYPDAGASTVMAAGAQAQIIRKSGEMVVVRLPSKYEVSILPTCIATVGRIGNMTHNQKIVGKAGRNRWKGIRPKSGFHQKKTGRFGKKIRKQKAAQIYTKPRKKRDIMNRVPFSSMPRSRIEQNRYIY